MGKKSEIAATMRKAADLLNQYSANVRQRPNALLESRRRKLEFEAKVKERRGQRP